MLKKIGVLTAGGDCPGLNAVIRAVVKTAMGKYNMDVVGVVDGYKGLVEGKVVSLSEKVVDNILPLGGTVLGSSNKENPLKYLVDKEKMIYKDMSGVAIEHLKKNGVEAMVIVGGDGTLMSAQAFQNKGMPTVGVPKTIDNDVYGTDRTFGFDTAVKTATRAIDQLRTTANAHRRVIVVEVMGRDAGWIALYAGMAGSASVILIPEIPYDINKVCDKIKQRREQGHRETIVVVSEAAKPINGEVVVSRVVEDSFERVRLGGVSRVISEQIEEITGIESRSAVLGHVQRGGSPSSLDRVLGTAYGEKAVELLVEGKYGNMVTLEGSKIKYKPFEEVLGLNRSISADDDFLKAARGIGVCFGD